MNSILLRYIFQTFNIPLFNFNICTHLLIKTVYKNIFRQTFIIKLMLAIVIKLEKLTVD